MNRFQIDDSLFQSGDVRDQVATMSEIEPKLIFLGRQFFWGEGGPQMFNPNL